MEYPVRLHASRLAGRWLPLVPVQRTTGRENGTPGDSGGRWSVFIDGRWQLVAVTSGGTRDLSYAFGNQTYAYPVTTRLEWIYGAMGVAPTLSIQPTTNGMVQVQWPSWATSYALQTSTNIAGADWAIVSGSVEEGTNRSLTMPITEPQRFWRLSKQSASAGLKSVPHPGAPVGESDDLIDHTP